MNRSGYRHGRVEHVFVGPELAGRRLLPLLAWAVIFAILAPSTVSAEEIGAARQPLSHNDRIWPDTNIPVCWENPSDADAQERGWVRDAVERSWQAVSAVRFPGWDSCAADSRGIRILIVDAWPLTQGLGTELDGRENGMILNFAFVNWGPECAPTREFCIRAIAVHEFGHALGFTHEQNRADRFNCTEAHQSSDPTVHITPYDPESIMNYCSTDWNNNGNLTPTDIAGVRSVYGPFTRETPAAFSYDVTMDIVDSETFGRNETGSRSFNGVLPLTDANPTLNARLSHCVGDEVRVDMDLTATLRPGFSTIDVEATATMFEGTSCSTLEREDRKTAPFSIGTLPVEGARLSLINRGVSSDTADITMNFTRTTGGTRVVDASSCADCVTESERARFIPKSLMASAVGPSLGKGEGAGGGTAGAACFNATQNRIAWDYSGNTKWSPANVEELCRGAETSAQPAKCFEIVMHTGVNWGGGTQWQWQNALDLCKGAQSASAVVSCFTNTVSAGTPWQDAIRNCRGAAVASLGNAPAAGGGGSDACFNATQNQIAWDYSGNTNWSPANIEELCRGAETSTQPAKCFEIVMHTGVNWGGGTQWQWQNALDLCKGAQSASAVVSCFTNTVNAGTPWQDAIGSCRAQ